MCVCVCVCVRACVCVCVFVHVCVCVCDKTKNLETGTKKMIFKGGGCFQFPEAVVTL